MTYYTLVTPTLHQSSSSVSTVSSVVPRFLLSDQA
jgi:hypothetical protein